MHECSGSRSVRRLLVIAYLVSISTIPAISFREISDLTRDTGHHIPVDYIIHRTPLLAKPIEKESKI
jgi:hypothetical protein